MEWASKTTSLLVKPPPIETFPVETLSPVKPLKINTTRAISAGCLLLLMGICAWGFMLTRSGPAFFDQPLLLWFRVSDDSARLAGPEWVGTLWHGLTRLGNTLPRLLLAGVMIAGLWLLHRWRSALFVAAVLSSGIGLSSAIKHWVGRPRPDLVAHLDHVGSQSFPSGHALNSTLFYLVAALVLACFLPHRGLRFGVYCAATGLILATGISRIALGVHYPSDVVAGWLIGVAWFGLWFSLTRHYWPRALP